MRALRGILAATVLATAVAAHAQQSLESAGSSSSLFLINSSALTADLAESSLSFTLLNMGVFGQHVGNTKVSVASQKYKREFFAKGEFTPSLTLEHRQFLGTGKGANLLNFFIGARYELTDNKFADTTAAGVYVLDHETGNTLAGALGTHFVHSAAGWRDFTVGAQLEGRGGWNSPGSRATQSVCTDKASGVDTAGAAVRVTKCEDRFIGDLENYAASVVGRLDFVGFRLNLNREKPDSSGTMLALLAAASTNATRGSKPTHGFAIGPALFPPNYPDVIVGALLFELNDAWNGSGQVEEIEDRFSVRLYLGIPFKF